MPKKRQVLEALKRDELLDAVDLYSLEVADRRVRALLVDKLSRSHRAKIDEILADYRRDRLKELCRDLGLDDSGRRKDVLVERLAGSPAAASPAARSPAKKPAPTRRKPVPPETPAPPVDATEPPASFPFDLLLSEDAGPQPFEPNDDELLRDLPQPGQIALVRSRRYLVEAVDLPASGEEQTVVHLSCLDDDAQGEALSVLWESEVDAGVLDGKAAWNGVAKRGFDPPDVFAAYYNTLRWHASTATDPKLFQAPFRAGIEIMAYQLEPLRKALALPRVNLFIADDVGLGKTIEAGLILRELLLRQKVRRVVVACPPSVVPQWRDELEQRFGLRFAVLDRHFVLERRRERGYAVNPWSTHTRFIVSHALLRNEVYAGPLRDWLQERDGGVNTLLILDEAHNFAPAAGSRYALDSKQTRALREIAPLFEHRLFLSATPHNGHSSSFSALLEILDKQRFFRGVPPSPRRRDEVLVRRLKSDLRKIMSGFPKRDVIQVDVDGLPDDAPELVLPRLLDQYRAAREERLADATKAERASVALSLSGLQKRLLSSIEAFARTLAVHRKHLEEKARKADEKRRRGRRHELRQDDLRRLVAPPGADDEDAELTDEELDAEVDAQMKLAAENDPNVLSDAEIALLNQMRDVAEDARYTADRRVDYLIDWIREHMCPDLGRPGAAWNRRRLIIFTEYTDTKRYLEEHLAAAVARSDQAEGRIAAYVGRGSMLGSRSQEEIRKAFNADPDDNPLRILLATEAAREGVNLQNHCADLFHFDLPWNPSRIEQRNGRIDRKLQRAELVRCHYFVFTQRPEDRVLKTLVKKTKTIREELGSLSNVVEQRLTTLLEDVVRRPGIDELCESIDGVETTLSESVRESVRTELEEARQKNLGEQLEALRDLQEKLADKLALDEEHFRHALSCALELLGAPPLKPLPAQNGGPRRFRFPALDRRLGADPTWAATLDTLRKPRPRDMKLWDWRKTHEIRPVIFEDNGSLDADCVHLHLEHPVVQRLLNVFRGRGFAEDAVSRAAMLMTRDAQRRVVLLGRLALYGEGASRLHEEIVAVTARWVEPERRGQDGLGPYASDGHQKTLSILSDAIKELQAADHHLAGLVLPHVATDVAGLLPHLEEKAAELRARAEELLTQRGAKEAREMEKILDAQRLDIEKEAAKYDERQLSFEWNALEARQIKLYHQRWLERLQEIEEEITSEPKRIAASYRVQVARVEPVGIVYLWPRSG